MLSRDDAVRGTAAPAASPSSASDLVKVVQQLWPEGLVDEPPVGQETVAPVSYAFVPTRSSARFLVPLSNRVSAGRTLRKYSASLTASEIAQRTAMSMAFRLGGSILLRDRVTVLGEHRSLRTYLSDWFGQPVSFSISIGTVRLNRKAVLQIFDRRGRTLAYAKVASTRRVIDDVQAEARSLRQIEDRLPAEIVAPQVLGTEVWEGSYVLLISPLDISMWQPLRGRWSPPVRQMQLLNEAFAEPDQLLGQTPMWRRLQAACRALDAGPVRDTFAGLLDEVESRGEARALRVGAWHGDWTSWNMARGGRRRVLLWDWERFETGVPAGMDHCHFLVNAAVRERRFSAEAIVAALDGLRPAGQHPTSSDLVVSSYLARLALRYTEGAQGPGGHVISRRAEILVKALDAWLSRSRS